MDRIELKVDPAVEAAEAVDELCSCVPELRAQWEAALEAASAEKLEALELPCLALSARPSKNFQVIGMLYKVVCAFLKEHEYPRRVVLGCLSEADATMYRQIYNFYIPNTKAERMNNGDWD